MRYGSSIAFALLALSSCTNSAGGREDQDAISGLYVLQRVDGMPIPAPLSAQQGCKRTVLPNGVLTISAAGPDVLPMYDWSFGIGADCNPIPPGVFQGSDDVGTWRFGSNVLLFNSLKGHGAYGATLDEAPGKPPEITIVQFGNSFTFVLLVRPDDPQGVVFVKFLDQSEQPVAGVRLIFTFANGLQSGGTTPASGEFGTKGVVGECKISITPPTGFAVPSSQPNPLSVAIATGDPLRVQVQLVKL